MKRILSIFIFCIIITSVIAQETVEIPEQRWDEIIQSPELINDLSDDELHDESNRARLDEFFQNPDNIKENEDALKRYLELDVELDFASGEVSYDSESGLLTNGDGNTISPKDIKKRDDIKSIIAKEGGGFIIQVKDTEFVAEGAVNIDDNNNIIASGNGQTSSIGGNVFNGNIVISEDGQYSISGDQASLEINHNGKNTLMKGSINVNQNIIDVKDGIYELNNNGKKISATGDFVFELGPTIKVTHMKGANVNYGKDSFVAPDTNLLVEVSDQKKTIPESLSYVQLTPTGGSMSGKVRGSLSLGDVSYNKKSLEGYMQVYDNFEMKNTDVDVIKKVNDEIVEHKTLKGTVKSNGKYFSVFNNGKDSSYYNHITGTKVLPTDAKIPVHILSEKNDLNKYSNLKNLVYESSNEINAKGKFEISKGNFNSFSKKYGNQVSYKSQLPDYSMIAVAGPDNDINSFQVSYGKKNTADYNKINLKSGTIELSRTGDRDKLDIKGTGALTKGIVYSMKNGLARADSMKVVFSPDNYKVSGNDLARISEFVTDDTKVLMSNRLDLSINDEKKAVIAKNGVMNFEDQRNIITYMGDYVGQKEIAIATDAELEIYGKIEEALGRADLTKANELFNTISDNSDVKDLVANNIKTYEKSLNVQTSPDLVKQKVAEEYKKYTKGVELVTANVKKTDVDAILSTSDNIIKEQQKLEKLKREYAKYAYVDASVNQGADQASYFERFVATVDGIDITNLPVDNSVKQKLQESIAMQEGVVKNLKQNAAMLIEKTYSSNIDSNFAGTFQGESAGSLADKALHQIKASAYSQIGLHDKAIEEASKVDGRLGLVNYQKAIKAISGNDIAQAYGYINDIPEDSMYYAEGKRIKENIASAQYAGVKVSIDRDAAYADKVAQERKIDAESWADPNALSMPAKAVTAVMRTINVFDSLGADKQTRLYNAVSASEEFNQYKKGYDIYGDLLKQGMTPVEIQTFANSNDKSDAFRLLGGGDINPDKAYYEKYRELQKAISHPLVKQSIEEYKNGKIDTSRFNLGMAELVKNVHGESTLALPYYQKAAESSSEYGAKAQEKVDQLNRGSLISSLVGTVTGDGVSAQNLIEGNYNTFGVSASQTAVDKYGEIAKAISGDPITWATAGGYSALRALGLAPRAGTLATAGANAVSKIPGMTTVGNLGSKAFNALKSVDIGAAFASKLPTVTSGASKISNAAGSVLNGIKAVGKAGLDWANPRIATIEHLTKLSGESFFLRNVGLYSDDLNNIARAEAALSKAETFSKAGNDVLFKTYKAEGLNLANSIKNGIGSISGLKLGTVNEASEVLNFAKEVVNSKFDDVIAWKKAGEISQDAFQYLNDNPLTRAWDNIDDFSLMSKEGGSLKLQLASDGLGDVAGFSDEASEFILSAASKNVDDVQQYANGANNAQDVAESSVAVDASKTAVDSRIKKSQIITTTDSHTSPDGLKILKEIGNKHENVVYVDLGDIGAKVDSIINRDAVDYISYFVDDADELSNAVFEYSKVVTSGKNLDQSDLDAISKVISKVRQTGKYDDEVKYLENFISKNSKFDTTKNKFVLDQKVTLTQDTVKDLLDNTNAITKELKLKGNSKIVPGGHDIPHSFANTDEGAYPMFNKFFEKQKKVCEVDDCLYMHQNIEEAGDGAGQYLTFSKNPIEVEMNPVVIKTIPADRTAKYYSLDELAKALKDPIEVTRDGTIEVLEAMTNGGKKTVYQGHIHPKLPLEYFKEGGKWKVKAVLSGEQSIIPKGSVVVVPAVEDGNYLLRTQTAVNGQTIDIIEGMSIDLFNVNDPMFKLIAEIVPGITKEAYQSQAGNIKLLKMAYGDNPAKFAKQVKKVLSQ